MTSLNASEAGDLTTDSSVENVTLQQASQRPSHSGSTATVVAALLTGVTGTCADAVGLVELPGPHCRNFPGRFLIL